MTSLCDRSIVLQLFPAYQAQPANVVVVVELGTVVVVDPLGNVVVVDEPGPWDTTTSTALFGATVVPAAGLVDITSPFAIVGDAA